MKATAQEARKRKQQTSLTSFFTKSSEQQQQQQQGQAERRYGSSTTQHQHHTAAAEKDVPTTSLLRIQPRQDDDNSHDGPLSLEEIADEDDLLLSELVTTKRTKTTINNKATTHAPTKRRKSKHSSSSQRHKGLENPWKAKKTPAASAVEETKNNVVNSNQSATSSSDSILHSVSANDDENDINTTASNPSSTTNNNINNNDATTIQNPPATAEPIKQSTKPTVDAILYNTSKNIVHQLNQRALLCGGGGRRTKKNPNNSSILFNHPPAFVDTSSWLFLSSHTTAGCRKVAWDYDRHPTTQARLGTLLACAYHDGWIRIFEVDTMHARDVFHKKKQQQQQCVVEALICFRTSLPALDMQWNPYCPDELAVQTQEGVQLFDLGEVKAWQDENHTGGGDHTTTTAWHTNATRVPCREFVCKVKSSTVATLLFVSDEQHILVATDDSVTCFSLYQPSTGSSSISSNKKSVWTLPWQRVSAMTCIQNSRDLILLGSTEGSFCVINVKRLHRVSFSVTVRPTIVCEWSSYRNNNYNNNSDVNACPAATWMGIQHIFADSLELLSEKLMIGLLTWVTSGGAIMSASNIELRGDNKSPRMTVHVHHSPKMIRCINAEKEDVPLSRPMWSFPSSRCRSHCTSELAVVEKVSQITRVLPGHDQRVMSTSSMDQMIHQDNSKPQLVLQWMQGSRKTTSIELRDAPLAVAIHPQQEWIAVGSNTFGVYLLHSRKR